MVSPYHIAEPVFIRLVVLGQSSGLHQGLSKTPRRVIATHQSCCKVQKLSAGTDHSLICWVLDELFWLHYATFLFGASEPA